MLEISDRSKSVSGESLQRIPPRIFQTFEVRTVPPKMYEATESWTELNEEYDYAFFDAKDRLEFIKENFDLEVVEAYNKVAYGAQRADIWRYCVLYLLGGVYVDVDFICVTPLTQIIVAADEFVAAKAHAPAQAVVNGFIASVPQHPFLRAALDRAVHNVLSDAPMEPMALTGPICLGEAVNLALGRPLATPFQLGAQEVNGLSFKLLEKRHVKGRSPHQIVDGSKTLFICKYPGYEADLESIGLEHWQAKLSREKRASMGHWLNAALRRIRTSGRRIGSSRSRE